METKALIVINGGLMLNLVIDGFEIATGKLNPMVKRLEANLQVFYLIIKIPRKTWSWACFELEIIITVQCNWNTFWRKGFITMVY